MDSFALLAAQHPWVLQYGYPAMLVVMFIEGPMITAFGGLAAAVGIFDVRVVFLFSILGNFIPDVVYYAIGYWGRAWFMKKYGPQFGDKLAKIEQLYQKHPFTALLFVKLVPVIATPGLMLAGAARIPLGKYSLYSMIIILVTSGMFLATGYYSGVAYVRYVHYQQIAYLIAVAVLGIVYLFNRLMVKLGKKLAPELAEK